MLGFVRFAIGAARELSARVSEHVLRLQRLPRRIPRTKLVVLRELLVLHHVERDPQELQCQHGRELLQLREQLSGRLLHAGQVVFRDLFLVHHLER